MSLPQLNPPVYLGLTNQGKFFKNATIEMHAENDCITRVTIFSM
jgi:hypothetical protein